jgi:UDP-N-acetylglucosamine 2-epimerase
MKVMEVADVIRKSDELMQKEKPDALLILGDTSSGLSVLFRGASLHQDV